MNIYQKALLIAASLCLVNTSASGAPYPQQPITLVVGFGAGGGADTTARIIQRPLEQRLGQSVVIENKTGGGGIIAASYVANAKPDGYTLLFTVNTAITINAAVQKNFPFDPRKALVPVSPVSDAVVVLAANPKLPFKSLQALIEYAKRNPGELSFATSGLGTAPHILGELINAKAGIDMLHVPYRGGNTALLDVISGRVPLIITSLTSVLQESSTGRLRPIAVLEKQRTEELPDVQAIAELFPGVSANAWNGVLAPGGTPTEVVEKLNAAITDVLKDPAVIKQLKGNGLHVKTTSVVQFRQEWDDELKFWKESADLTGVKID